MDKRDTGLRDIVTVLFKQKKKIIATFLLIVIAALVGTILMKPTYQANSSLLVKFGREYMYTPEVGEGRPMSVAISQEELLNSELQILSNRDLIEKVIAKIGIGRLYPELSSLSGLPAVDRAVAGFTESLGVESVKKSNVISVTFQHHNPELSAKALNLLVDFFRDKHLEIYAGTNSSFLTEQLIAYGNRLKESDAKLEAFKGQHRIFSIEEQRSNLLKQRMDADTADKDAENRIGELTKRIESLHAQMRSVEKQVPVSSEADRLRATDDADTQLLNLRLREQELLDKYPSNNRLVINVRKEIELLEGFLKKRKETEAKKVITGRNAVYEEMEKDLVKARADLASFMSRRSSLRHQIGAIDTDLKELDSRAVEFQTLKRERDLNEKNYQIYLDRAEVARISDRMNRQKMANVTVIQHATVPSAPIKPRMGKNLLFALVIGTVAGLGLAFASEYMAQSLSTPESTEKRLQIPVIGSVKSKA